MVWYWIRHESNEYKNITVSTWKKKIQIKIKKVDCRLQFASEVVNEDVDLVDLS